MFIAIGESSPYWGHFTPLYTADSCFVGTFSLVARVSTSNLWCWSRLWSDAVHHLIGALELKRKMNDIHFFRQFMFLAQFFNGNPNSVGPPCLTWLPSSEVILPHSFPWENYELSLQFTFRKTHTLNAFKLSVQTLCLSLLCLVHIDMLKLFLLKNFFPDKLTIVQANIPILYLGDVMFFLAVCYILIWMLVQKQLFFLYALNSQNSETLVSLLLYYEVDLPKRFTRYLQFLLWL